MRTGRRLHKSRAGGVLAVFACRLLLGAAPLAHAQDKGEPGKFDFYLMNVAWGPEFCGVPGAGPQCRPPRGFVLHGLWTQFTNGTYPVFCSDEPGPRDLSRYLDLTPDLPLLQHEWDKHGTCAAVGPERFFRMEREAFRALKVPARFAHVDHELTLVTADVLADFYQANPHAPEGSLLLSCSKGRLTAVEECFTKGLKPMRCAGLHGCEDRSLKVAKNSARVDQP